MIEDTKDEIETEHFYQMVQGPTHFWVGHQDSLIDQSWTNCPERIISCKNVTRATADHNMIQTVFRTKGQIGGAHEIVKRCRKDFDLEQYKSEVESINWSPLFEMENVNNAYDYFESSFLKILDKMAPMIKIQPRRVVTNWVTVETRKCMTLRDIARDNAAKSKRPDDWGLYKRLKNKCNRLVRNDKAQHNKKVYNLHVENRYIAGLYRTAKNSMGIKSGGKPTSFLVGGETVSAPQKVANLQMQYFHEKITKLMEDLPNSNFDPLHYLKLALARWGDKVNTRPEFKLEKINEN